MSMSYGKIIIPQSCLLNFLHHSNLLTPDELLDLAMKCDYSLPTIPRGLVELILQAVRYNLSTA